ncbi:MAG: hypothetical protein AAGH57_04535 [Pseudomonadota bacterium]
MIKTVTSALCVVAALSAAPLAANKNTNKNAVALPSEEESVLGGTEYTKDPERWELSYDIAMQPYLADYKKCLGYGNRVFDGNPNVEAQHREDIPRCVGVRKESVKESNAAIARRGRTEGMPPAAVEKAFDTIAQIHVQRGRNLDDLFQLQMRAVEERRLRYEAQVAARQSLLEVSETENVDLPNVDN